jgi:hypothetical protein
MRDGDVAAASGRGEVEVCGIVFFGLRDGSTIQWGNEDVALRRGVLAQVSRATARRGTPRVAVGAAVYVSGAVYALAVVGLRTVFFAEITHGVVASGVIANAESSLAVKYTRSSVACVFDIEFIVGINFFNNAGSDVEDF